MRRDIIPTLALLLYLGAAGHPYCFAQNIYTVAGGGLGDNGAAVNAALPGLGTVFSDREGNTYVVGQVAGGDPGTKGIRKISPNGIITVLLSSYNIGNCTIDDVGNLYFTVPGYYKSNSIVYDPFPYAILKYDKATGLVSRFAGNGQVGNTGDGGPALNAKIDPYGLQAVGNKLYLSQINTADYSYRFQSIRVIDLNTGIISTLLTAGTVLTDEVGNPVPIGTASQETGRFTSFLMADRLGRLYFLESYNAVYGCWCTTQYLKRVDLTNGTLATIAGNNESIYITGMTGNGGPANQAKLYPLYAITIDGAGNIYLAERNALDVTAYIGIRKIDANTGVISMVAGGEPGYLGDNGPALQARFHSIISIYAESSGSLLISDDLSQIVRKIRTDGIITKIAGNGFTGIGLGYTVYAGDFGQATEAALGNPLEVFVDTKGDIYIGDYHNAVVRKVSKATGVITTVAGNGNSGVPVENVLATNTTLYNVTGIVVNQTGDLFISMNNRIVKVDGTTGILTYYAGNATYPIDPREGDGGLAKDAPITNYSGITIDKNGNIFFCNNYSTVRRIDALTGIISTVAGSGVAGYSGDGGPAISAQLNGVVDVAVDASGSLYIAETSNHVIRKVDGQTGIITTIAGSRVLPSGPGNYGDGGPAIDAIVYQPSCLAVDNSDNLYLYSFYWFRKISLTTGTITAFAGRNPVVGVLGDNGPAMNALFNMWTSATPVAGIATDVDGNVYVADNGNGRIRKIITTANIASAIMPETYDHSQPLKASITVDNASKAKLVVVTSKGITQPESAYISTTLSPKDNTYETTLTPTDPIGVQYQFEVTDEASVSKRSALVNAYVHYPATSQAQVFPDLVFGGDPEDYNLISVPLRLKEKSVLSVFDELGPYDNRRWRIFGYNYTGNLTELNLGHIEIGKGYWLIARRFALVNPGEGDAAFADATNPFQLTLTAGWNLIGNPYNFTVAWDDFVAANPTLGNLEGFYVFRNGVLEVSDRLLPYQGAYLRTPISAAAKVPVLRNAAVNSRKATRQGDQVLNDSDWVLPVTVSSGALTNHLCAFGMNPGAANGLDALDRDRFPTPASLSLPELTFSETGTFLHKDIRPTASTMLWNARITGGEVTLAWDHRSVARLSGELYLMLPDLHAAVDMKERGDYRIPAGTEEVLFVYGSKEEIRKKLDHVLNVLSTPYPNPAVDKVNIQVHILQEEGSVPVSVRAVDLLGHDLATLYKGTLEPGTHTLSLPLALPAGTYILRATAGSRISSSQKLVVMK